MNSLHNTYRITFVTNFKMKATFTNPNTNLLTFSLSETRSHSTSFPSSVAETPVTIVSISEIRTFGTLFFCCTFRFDYCER